MRDPDGAKQQIILEVMERLDNTIKTLENIVVEWGKRKQQEPPANSEVTPKMEK